MSDAPTALERYRTALESRTKTIVQVTAPSGFVFVFEQPSKIAMLFQGEMPQALTNLAAKAWTQNGLLKPADIKESDALALYEKARDQSDRVLKLSYKPKIVRGPAQNENELSTDDISDEDLTYLFAWVGAGGDEAAALATFRRLSGQNAGTRVNGKGHKGKGK